MDKGHSLLELMVVIAVGAVLAAVTLPTLGWVLETQRRAAAINRLVAAIHLARSEVLRRSESVTICASPDGRRCGSTDDWNAGWRMFIGEPPGQNRENLAEHRAGDELRVIANRARFTFRTPVRRSTNGTVTFCPRNDDAGSARADVVNHVGRPRLDAGAQVSARCVAAADRA